MSCSFPRAGLTWAQDSFRIKVPKTCNEGLTPRPFLFSDGRIHRISIRKVMKSGASRISKNIRLFSVIHSGDGGDVRAVTKRGTALFPRPDHLRPNRIGSGTMPCRKRVSERLRRASTHYATRTLFFHRKSMSGSDGRASFSTVIWKKSEPMRFPKYGKANTGECGSEPCERVVPLFIRIPTIHLSGVRRRCRPVMKLIAAVLLSPPLAEL